MWKRIVMMGVAICSGLFSYAQSSKYFAVENTGDFKKVFLEFSSTSGICYVSPSTKPEALSVYGNRDIDNYNHSFDKKIEDKTLSIELNIEDKTTENFSQSISDRVFKNNKEYNSSVWKVFLSDDKLYDLRLNFGIGDAFIDLSGLNVQNLTVNTGSADVNIGYLTGIGNQYTMDTFNVKVDLGSVQMRKLSLANAKVIMAEVGFGDAYLDLSERPAVSSYIDASVGAGNLVVVVPRYGTGIKIIVNSSMLCQVRLSKSFQENEPDVFINEYYEEGGDNQLVFDVDVSLGSIQFKEKK